MSELNEVKKKLGEAFGLLWLTLRVKFARPSSGHKRRRRRHTKLKIIVVLVCLAVGGGLIFFSSPGSVSGDPSNLGLGAGGSNFSLIRFLFAPVIPVPGLQRDGSFVLSDFEQVDDMKAWSVVSATMKPSVTHVSTGAQSAKMTLYGGGDVAAVQIEDYFTSKKGVSDWSSFEYLSFYIFNPQRVSEKLILQVKDQNGRYFKEDIHVPASGGEEFKIPVEKIGAFLDITRIDQFSLFAWQMKGEKEFYLDDLKLLLRGYRDIERRAAETAVPLKIRPVKPLDYGFAYRKPAWMAVDTQGGGNIVRIPFVVANETNAMCALCPVEGGVPMPLGEKTNVTKMRVRDSQGRDLQFQARVLSRWTDGSVKWLGVSFPLTLGPREGQGFVLEYGQNINTIDFSTDLHAQESGEDILISTGPMRVKLSKQNFTLFDEVYVDKNSDGMFDKDELLVSAAPLVLTHNDTEFRTDVTGEDYKIEIEEQGPYRVVVKASGWFQAMKGKDRFGKVVLRYYFYSGRGYVKLSHTLIYTGYPANKQFLEYESLKLPENETIQSFGFRLPYQLSFQGIPEVKTGVLAPGQPLVFQGGNSIRVAQLKWDQTVVQTDDVMMPTNALASGWIQVADEQSGITVAVKDFRELFPKALGVDHGKKEVIVDLWPAEAGELDLKTTPPALGVGAAARGSAFGLGKTHEILIGFHSPGSPKELTTELAEAFKERLLIRPNPYWVDATGALGRLLPVDPRYERQESLLEQLFGWAIRPPIQNRWYGMLDYGDTLSWHRNQDDDQWYPEYDWHPVGRWGWYNCEGSGTHTGALLQFARSGNWQYFEFGENLARHIMDVDTIHYDTIANDPRLKNLLDKSYSQVGSMHRHNADHWGGRSDEASHTNVWGLILYHYITGDERARDVALEVGEFFLSEPFTYAKHPDVAPARALANTLWGDVLLYELTGEEKFKNGADKIIEVFLKGQQADGSFLENYNPMDGSDLPG